MYKTIRKKVASTVSQIEITDNFAWGKWLKESPVHHKVVEGFDPSLYDTSHLNSWLEKPVSKKRRFDFKEAFIFPESKHLILKKLKTNAVFFGIGKIEIKKINLLDLETALKKKIDKTNFEFRPVRLKEVFSTPLQSDIQEFSFRLKSDIIKINLLEADNLSKDKLTSTGVDVEQLIPKPPKIYKVKIIGLDKIKLSKIYYLKNISLHEVRLLRESYKPLSKPIINIEELKYFGFEEKKKPEVIIEDIIPDIINQEELIESEAELEIFPEQLPIIINESFEDSETPEDLEIEKESEPVDLEKDIKIPEGISETAEVKVKKTFESVIETPEIPEVISKVTEETGEADETDEDERATEDASEVEDDYENNFESLYSFQETGAEFLLDSKRAVLADELGLGKTLQVIAALKNNFAGKKIKSAIIICEELEIGSRGQIPGENDGWIGHLHQKASELKVETAKGTAPERKKQWKNLPDVLVISYDSFFSDIDGSIIDLKELKKVGCLVFDEIQILFDNKTYKTSKLPKSINPKYLWALSSHPEDSLKEKVDKVFKDKLSIKNYLGRSKKEIEADNPNITWVNKWLTLDDEQSVEYNEAFATAKEKVQWFLASGNPLRFNANVFTLLHQLKQVCNFSEKKGKSKKTALLLEQVNRIAENKKKVVIFSQYDKSGTKKIEDILKKNNISFLSYAPGMSTKEMETTLKNFTSSASKGITALVAGVKPSRIKIPAGDIPYVIHFDTWWNPASLWQTEEALSGSLKKESKNLTVYSYLMKNSVEERIHSLLFNKGFLNKQIMETINPDSISEMITNPEWLEIFDMPDEEYKQKYQKGLLETEKRIDSYSLSDFALRMINFLTKLGYKNLDTSENKAGDSIDIRGIYKKAKFDQQMCTRFLLKDIVTEDEVNTHLAVLKEKTNNGKVFLITKGSFETDKSNYSNEALIDRNALINYFYQFIII